MPLSFIVAVTLAGCASTREESALAFQQHLPRLIAACNVAFSSDASISQRDALKACDRLAEHGRLGLADPATVVRYQAQRIARRMARDNGGASSWPSSTNEPTTPFRCSSLPACP
jgi:hypothetical protein